MSLFSIALAAGSGAILTGSSQAGAREAPFFFGQNVDRPRMDIPRRPDPTLRIRPPVKKGTRPNEKVVKEAPVSPGPHLLVVSIKSQRISLYSNGKLVTQSPISSGTDTHPTPHGVFSIIQRNRHHRSNIYSGAPMPYMQRLTWSGIALHQGALPGRPASHGCIRLPESFANLLWRTTRMNTRVIVAREDVEPQDIAHAKLFQPKVPATTVETAPPLRKTFDTTTPATIRTAAMRLVVTDAEIEKATGEAEAAAPADRQPEAPNTPTAEAEATEPKRTESKTVEPAIELKPAIVESQPSEPQAPAPAPARQQETAQPQPAPSARPEPRLDIANPEPGERPKTPVAVEAATPDSAKQDITATAYPKADIPEDILASFDRSLEAKAKKAAPAGPVSVFISRKDKRLYVRQAFIPMFTAPVNFRDGDAAFGTHVFTAYTKDGEDKSLRWTAITLPAEHAVAERPKPTYRIDQFGRRIEVPARAPSRAPEPVQASPRAASVLDRIDIPQDVADRISEYMSAGSSLIVSDLGLGYETGLYTDFIVVTKK